MQKDISVDGMDIKAWDSVLIKQQPTPPVTSTIEEVDIDKAVTKIWQLMFGACRTPQHPYNKELKEILSSLSPIQKKRTREYVWDSMKWLPCVTAFMINQTYKFLEKEWMLQE